MKKSNFFMTMRSWTLVMLPLFSVSDPLSVKLTIFKIWPYLKLSIFSQQLISPKLLYFGNPEDSGNDVGDFFAHKLMQIPNIETVFESELTWNFLYHALFNLLFNVNFLGHLEDSKLFNHTVLVTKWPSFRIPRSICAIDQKIFSLSLKIVRKMTFAISILKFFFQKKFFARNCLIRKDHRLLLWFAKIFLFFVVDQQISEIFEKVEFLHGHEELCTGNGIVLSLEWSSFRKAKNFLKPTHFKIIDF